VRALKYLAPYVFRVAISNKRILRLAEGKVTLRGRIQTPTPPMRQPVRCCAALPVAGLCNAALSPVPGHAILPERRGSGHHGAPLLGRS
jgi:hypothetical protein